MLKTAANFLYWVLPAPTLLSLPLPLLQWVCDRVVAMLASCHMSLCFSGYIQVPHCHQPQTPPSYAISSYPLLPRSPHARLCFHWWQLICHHATWDPVKATGGKRWTPGCCLVPTHVYLYFGANSLYDFVFGCQAILLCLSQLIQTLLG